MRADRPARRDAFLDKIGIRPVATGVLNVIVSTKGWRSGLPWETDREQSGNDVFARGDRTARRCCILVGARGRSQRLPDRRAGGLCVRLHEGQWRDAAYARSVFVRELAKSRPTALRRCCSPCRKAQRSRISIPPLNPISLALCQRRVHTAVAARSSSRLRARRSAQARSGNNQDRHLMTPSPLTQDCPHTNRSRRHSSANVHPRARPPILSALTPQTSPRNAPPVHRSPYSPAEPSPQPRQSKPINPDAATKSP
jgi:hypothetical protein